MPGRAIVVFSAHGVSPEVHKTAAERNLKTIDATCPLVTKVHQEAKRFACDDYDILLIGHEGHEEVEGTAGEAPEHIQLVDGPASVENVAVRDESKVIWLADHPVGGRTMATVDRLRERFPHLSDPPRVTTSATPPRTVGGGGQGDGPAVRAGDRGGSGELLQLGAAGGGGAARTVPTPPTSSTTHVRSTRPGSTGSPRSASPLRCVGTRGPRTRVVGCSPNTATTMSRRSILLRNLTFALPRNCAPPGQPESSVSKTRVVGGGRLLPTITDHTMSSNQDARALALSVPEFVLGRSLPSRAMPWLMRSAGRARSRDGRM